MASRVTGSNIASAINAAHAGVEAAKREGARHAVECGRLLSQAKDTVPHGSWDAWADEVLGGMIADALGAGKGCDAEDP